MSRDLGLFGLDHPSWIRPTNFFYKTADEAWDAIDKVYGFDSGHIVVGPISRPATTTPAPEETP